MIMVIVMAYLIIGIMIRYAFIELARRAFPIPPKLRMSGIPIIVLWPLCMLPWFRIY
jgi:hypothetical protein